MEILNKTIEREGNDAWLIDKVILLCDNEEFTLLHTKIQKGNNTLSQDYVLHMPYHDICEAQQKLNAHLYEHSIDDYISIDLKTLLVEYTNIEL